MDSLLEKLIQRILDVWNHKMKRNVIFMGWSNWKYIFMKNSKLLFKYIVIKHVVAYYFILWNVLNYQKKETCDAN